MFLISKLVTVASQVFPRLSSRVLASSGYTLDLDSFGPRAFDLWRDDAARRQDRAWQPIVERAKAGHPRQDVSALYMALDTVLHESSTLLEVGCGGGYNSELVVHRYPDAAYEGVDISESMIRIAEAHYPARHFTVASAYELPFGDRSRDIVVDGVALIHMPEWKRAIAEYARVARQAIVLHGLTLAESAATTPFGKYAYGQTSIELLFNREELLAECTMHGLVLDGAFPGLDYQLEDYIGIPSVSETWVLGR